MTLVLRKSVHVNYKTVKRLMKEMPLFEKMPRGRYNSYKGDRNGTAGNYLLMKEIDPIHHKTIYKRHFETSAPNQKWTIDVSEFHMTSGKLYLSPIQDMYNGEIAACQISAHPNFQQIFTMLHKAFHNYPHLKGLILPSDQGWQYPMKQYRQILMQKGIIQSMSRKGNCLDHCVIENFLGKLKVERFYGHEYEFHSLGELKTAIEEYIDYYNTKRIQVRLNGLTPCEARNQAIMN